MATATATLLAVAFVGACTTDTVTVPDDATSQPDSDSTSTSAPTQPEQTTPPPTTENMHPPTTETMRPPPAAQPAQFRADFAFGTVRHLANQIGPRHATSPAFAEAVDWTSARLRTLEYDVQFQQMQVPGGDSWGFPVSAGISTNVIAATSDYTPTRPYLLVGAHLDTVPPAPGAEDNASGVAVVLELARLASRQETRLPVVFILFGAEEPRGSGDDLHHFGSTAYVEQMGPAERANLDAMVSLDRVGVGQVVPLCTGGLSPLSVQQQLARAAVEVGVATSSCTDNQASDHWSFEKAGFEVARVGSTPYAAYHSAADVPAVVSQPQLRRVGTAMWRWLTR